MKATRNKLFPNVVELYCYLISHKLLSRQFHAAMTITAHPDGKISMYVLMYVCVHVSQLHSIESPIENSPPTNYCKGYNFIIRTTRVVNIRGLLRLQLLSVIMFNKPNDCP